MHKVKPMPVASALAAAGIAVTTAIAILTLSVISSDAPYSFLVDHRLRFFTGDYVFESRRHCINILFAETHA